MSNTTDLGIYTNAVDDMAERCDRLEAELMMRESVVAEGAITVTRDKSEEADEEEDDDD